MTSCTLDLDPPSATSSDVFLHLSSWQSGYDDNDSGGDDDNDGSFYDGDDDDDSFPLTMVIQDVKLMDSSNHENDSSQCGNELPLKLSVDLLMTIMMIILPGFFRLQGFNQSFPLSA